MRLATMYRAAETDHVFAVRSMLSYRRGWRGCADGGISLTLWDIVIRIAMEITHSQAFFIIHCQFQVTGGAVIAHADQP